MSDGEGLQPFIGITVEALLHPCEIYPVQTAVGYGYVWEWSDLDHEAHSKHSFDLFFDCLDDARRHGFEPHFLDRGHTAELAVVPVGA